MFCGNAGGGKEGKEKKKARNCKLFRKMASIKDNNTYIIGR
jgi:hypothetical protein